MTAVPLPLEATGTQTISGQDGAHEGPLVQRTVLAGGVRVLTESVPGLRSATLGAWVGVGSRDEADGHLGSTHFLEHLLFKGTARRSALDIAAAFDAVGGESNAATGKEHTTYYARVIDTDLPLAVDVVADMVTSATLDPDDLEGERQVILEELAMNDDDPVDVAHERFTEQVFGATSPLGRPIGGTAQSILDVPRDAVWEHYQQHYTAPGLVVTAAGGVDHDAVCGMVADALARAGWGERSASPLPRRPLGGPAGAGAGTGSVTALAASLPGSSVLTVDRPTEQANVLLGGAGLCSGDPRRFVLAVLNAVLGGGMSSRLFQEVREERGLAYSVYSFASGYADAGLFGVYAGCSPSKVPEVVELLAAEWRGLAEQGLRPGELERAVGQVSGSTVLALEDSGSRMSRLGRAELVHGEYASLETVLARTRSVTADQVQELAAELWAAPHHLTVVGPFDTDPLEVAP
ncbi:pitrilysin family protein [Quadrisphaera sp. INWT6]|uniref:M16 family metallopeptidase n=1 Tax=Quadrisphaera sp. INWT6 TaxID=2596917 RepID=UPI0018926EEA|nr:pitrilysin family protein [Quadrisphaera sp. INWT6]MBF5080733.1 insulinase family protein [Quadrisphaera sp. INWT6]